MDNSQADAIAQAILEPDLRIQAELRNKRILEAAQLARQRRVAGFALAGSAVGAAIAYFAGGRFSLGIICGGLAGSAIGWLLTRKTD